MITGNTGVSCLSLSRVRVRSCELLRTSPYGLHATSNVLRLSFHF
jgi:hypothetical protein